MLRKLQMLQVRLSQKIESASKLCSSLVSDANRKAAEELNRIVEILSVPTAAMNKATVAFIGSNAELAIAEICRMERRYLISLQMLGEVNEARNYFDGAPALKQAYVEFLALRNRAVVDTRVSTAELRQKYDHLVAAYVKARIEHVVAPKPPVREKRHNAAREARRAERLSRQPRKGVNPPADKHGHREKRRATA